MALVTLPSNFEARNSRWNLVQPAQENVSSWTGKRQVLASGRGWWECSYSPPTIVGRGNARPWIAFIAKLKGKANTVKVPVDGEPQNPFDITEESLFNPTLILDFVETDYAVDADPPAFNNTATVVEKVSSRSVKLSRVEAGYGLEAGHYLTIGDQLVCLTENPVTDASDGLMTVEFEPPLRAPSVTNEPVEYRRPYAVMALAESADYSQDSSIYFAFSFEFREAF